MADKAHNQDPPRAVVENTEPIAVGNSEKEFVDLIDDNGPLSSNHESEKGGDEKRPEAERLRSYATNTSGFTRTDSHVEVVAPKKPWFERANPLRWGGIPPVPESRGPSREHTAGFFSLVYFQWIAPLMAVCYCFQKFICHLLIYIGWLQTTPPAKRYMDRKPRPSIETYERKTTSFLQEESGKRR